MNNQGDDVSNRGLLQLHNKIQKIDNILVELTDLKSMIVGLKNDFRDIAIEVWLAQPKNEATLLKLVGQSIETNFHRTKYLDEAKGGIGGLLKVVASHLSDNTVTKLTVSQHIIDFVQNKFKNERADFTFSFRSLLYLKFLALPEYPHTDAPTTPRQTSKRKSTELTQSPNPPTVAPISPASTQTTTNIHTCTIFCIFGLSNFDNGIFSFCSNISFSHIQKQS
eukprot:TRINITY_DN1327_c0_g1_i12.p1 TRINITY_DN1327_c0_g1~~TRINITY_DN1327_c0_g1_i12.p1  ORF type:complete len:223 (+),score=30.95 TRINITY_DN1327_c0_g1_i12:964-1632(+)